jgi:hypothetical protein
MLFFTSPREELAYRQAGARSDFLKCAHPLFVSNKKKNLFHRAIEQVYESSALNAIS